MELKELVGLHQLTGVDRLKGVEMETEWGVTEHGDVLRFTLDGVTYLAREDPSDGYRSALRDVIVSSEPTVNQFPAVQVFGVWRDYWGYSYRAEVLQLLTMKSEQVLAVGTTNSDDYYPSFVAEFDPTVLGEVASA